VSEVGDRIEADNAGWSFGGAAEHFDRHVRRSVPLYDVGHELVAALSDFFLSDGSICYDLGCSTGALCARLARRHAAKQVQIVGCDREPGMVQRARAACREFPAVEIREDDLLSVEYEPADFIVAYYTLQFVRPQVRQLAIDRLYAALNWGGGLVVFEKVRGPDARFQDIATAIYTDFKLDRGYTGNEIVAKSRSLKGVLEPFSTAGNLGLLHRAGFIDIMTVMKYVCFEGFLAIK